MTENNPVTVAEEKKRLEENPITPVNPPVTTATEVPTAPTVSVEANKEVANLGGTAPVDASPQVSTPAPTDYKWDATTNSYKEVPKTETTTPAPTPTATPKATVAPPEANTGTEAKPQEYYDQFKGRENEVLTNLNSAYSSGIKDAEGIKKFASYDTATPEKKAAIDAFIANKQKEELSAKEGSQFGSEEGIFGALNNNVMVPDSVKSSPAYKSAFDRYRKLKFLSGYDANSIAAILKNGKLVPGSRTYQDLYNTAIGKANIEKANKILSISGNAVDVTQAGKNLTQETLKENPTIAKALEDGEISIEEFKALTSSPELEAEAKVLAEKQLEIKKLQSERNKIRDDVDKKYGGFVTASERAQIVANRTRDINRTLEPLVLEYESAFGTYSEKKKEALSLFSTNYELYKEKKAEEAKKSTIEEQRDYETKKEARKNIYDSVSSQIKFALENGVDLKRTDANVVIADAKAYATANGVSLEEGIKKTFTEPLTSKPSYRAALQAIYDKNSGALTPFQKAQLANLDRDYALDVAKFGLERDKVEAETNKTAEPKWGILGTNRNGDTVYGWIPPYSTGELSSPMEEVDTISYIKSKEGFRSEAYQDSGGVWTIGYGFTTRADGSPVRKGDTMDEQTADELLERKVKTYQNFKNKITVPLSSAQESALTSFEYNLGRNIWDKSAKPIIDKINSGDFAGAAEYLKKFNTVKGTVVRGLTNRRNEEAKMLSSAPSTGGLASSLSLQLDKPVVRPPVVEEKGYDPAIVDVYKRINTGKAIPETERRSLGIDANTLSAEARAYGKELDKQGAPSVDRLISQLKEIRSAKKGDRLLSKGGFAGELASPNAAKFAATYNNIIAKTALKELIDLKNEGATFGALSNQELNFITDASDTGELKTTLPQDEWERKVDMLIGNAERLKTKIEGGLDFVPPPEKTPASTANSPTSGMGAVERLKYLRSQSGK